MAKLTLELEEDYAYHVFGIVSTSRGHRLCWTINKGLGLDLSREKDIEILSKKNHSRHHAFYSYFDENLQVRFRLIENKKGASLFLPEVKNADYLWVGDQSLEADTAQTLERLRSLDTILMAFPVNLEQLRSKQNILLAA